MNFYNSVTRINARGWVGWRVFLRSCGTFAGLAAYLLLPSAAGAGNLVMDPNFASATEGTSYGSPTPVMIGPWLFSGAAGIVFGSTADSAVGNPTYMGTATAFVNDFASSGEISQNIPTIAGDTYLIDLFLAGNCCLSGDVSASFAGVLGYSAALNASEFIYPYPYQKESFTEVASSLSSTFVFDAQIPSGTVFLGRVSITNLTEPQSLPSPSEAPEPASIQLIAASTGAFALWWRRRGNGHG